jgi:hypothetical protein
MNRALDRSVAQRALDSLAISLLCGRVIGQGFLESEARSLEISALLSSSGLASSVTGRDHDAKRGSAEVTRPDGDIPAMRLGDSASDCESKAGAAGGPPLRPLAVSVEDGVALPCRDSGTGVGDFEDELSWEGGQSGGFVPNSKANTASLRREFERVGHDVIERLAQLRAIGSYAIV